MRNEPNLHIEKYRMMHAPESAACAGTNSGAFTVPFKKAKSFDLVQLCVIASNGGGWDHVSVHVYGVERCPTWEEMFAVNRLFFKDDEWTMQLHPPEKENLSCHPFTLHIWRPQTDEERAAIAAKYGTDPRLPNMAYGPIPLPPSVMVAPHANPLSVEEML